MRKQSRPVPFRFFPAHRTRHQFAHQSRYCLVSAGTKLAHRHRRGVADGALDGIEKTHWPLLSPIVFFVRTVAPISPRASRTEISSPSVTCSAERNTRPAAS